MDWKNFSGKIRKITKRKREENNKSLLTRRLRSFEQLLSEINMFHKLMADMEEKLTGKFPIGWNYMDYNFRSIAPDKQE